LSLYNSSFSAQVPCILVCALCVRLPTRGFPVLSVVLEPLFGFLTLDSSRYILCIHHGLLPSLEWRSCGHFIQCAPAC
jgi:hypothetical protein